MAKKACKVCGKDDGPSIFDSDDWCSDDCRKMLLGEYSESTFTIVTGKAFNPETGLYDMDINKRGVKIRKAWDKKRTDSTKLTL